MPRKIIRQSTNPFETLTDDEFRNIGRDESSDDEDNHSVQQDEFDEYRQTQDELNNEISDYLDIVSEQHKDFEHRLNALEEKVAQNKGKPTPEDGKELIKIREAVPDKEAYNNRATIVNFDSPEGRAAFEKIHETLRKSLYYLNGF